MATAVEKNGDVEHGLREASRTAETIWKDFKY